MSKVKLLPWKLENLNRAHWALSHEIENSTCVEFNSIFMFSIRHSNLILSNLKITGLPQTFFPITTLVLKSCFMRIILQFHQYDTLNTTRFTDYILSCRLSNLSHIICCLTIYEMLIYSCWSVHSRWYKPYCMYGEDCHSWTCPNWSNRYSMWLDYWGSFSMFSQHNSQMIPVAGMHIIMLTEVFDEIFIEMQNCQIANLCRPT